MPYLTNLNKIKMKVIIFLNLIFINIIGFGQYNNLDTSLLIKRIHKIDSCETLILKSQLKPDSLEKLEKKLFSACKSYDYKNVAINKKYFSFITSEEFKTDLRRRESEITQQKELNNNRDKLLDSVKLFYRIKNSYNKLSDLVKNMLSDTSWYLLDKRVSNHDYSDKQFSNSKGLRFIARYNGIKISLYPNYVTFTYDEECFIYNNIVKPLLKADDIRFETQVNEGKQTQMVSDSVIKESIKNNYYR